MSTTAIYALLEPDAPVIRYIGQSIDAQRRFSQHALAHVRPFRELILHEAVPVGDVASYFEQEEITHAIRAGHPLINDRHLPYNLLKHAGVVDGREASLRLLNSVRGGTEGELAALMRADAEVCAAAVKARRKGVQQQPAHPSWRLDVRTRRTGTTPPAFTPATDHRTEEVPLLTPSGDDRRIALLERFAVVTTGAGLQAIADAYVMWESGQRARHNRDATGGRKASGGIGGLRLPGQDFVSILQRHIPAAVAELEGWAGMRVERGSLVLRTSSPEQLEDLADRLVDIAAVVWQSNEKPVRQSTTDHDAQQVLLRASQAQVLAGELRADDTHSPPTTTAMSAPRPTPHLPQPSSAAADDIDDPMTGALVPTSRTQLEQFEAAGSNVILPDGRQLHVRRHRDALNHMRQRDTDGRVTWGIRRKAWDEYVVHMRPTTDRERAGFDRLSKSVSTDEAATNATLQTSDPLDLEAYADLLEQVRRRYWIDGQVGRAREVAVYIGAARVRAQELADDLHRQ